MPSLLPPLLFQCFCLALVHSLHHNGGRNSSQSEFFYSGETVPGGHCDTFNISASPSRDGFIRNHNYQSATCPGSGGCPAVGRTPHMEGHPPIWLTACDLHWKVNRVRKPHHLRRHQDLEPPRYLQATSASLAELGIAKSLTSFLIKGLTEYPRLVTKSEFPTSVRILANDYTTSVSQPASIRALVSSRIVRRQHHWHIEYCHQ